MATSFTVYNDQSLNALYANTINAANLTVGGSLEVNGNLTVNGAIRPGTFTNRVVPILSTVTAVNLTAADSGTTYALTLSGAIQPINLPAPSVAGLGTNFKFVCVAGGAAVVNIISRNAAGASIALQAGTQSLVGANPVDGSTPTANSQFAAAAIVGDCLTLECVIAVDTLNSPSWHYRAVSNAAGGILFS